MDALSNTLLTSISAVMRSQEWWNGDAASDDGVKFQMNTDYESDLKDVSAETCVRLVGV